MLAARASREQGADNDSHCHARQLHGAEFNSHTSRDALFRVVVEPSKEPMKVKSHFLLLQTTRGSLVDGRRATVCVRETLPGATAARSYAAVAADLG